MSSRRRLQILLLLLHLNRWWALGAPQAGAPEAEAPEPPDANPPVGPACSLFKYVGVNDLGINDIVVRSAHDETACIKARFSLAIKVVDVSSSDSPEAERVILGYLPLDSVIGVRNSCPEAVSNEGATNATSGGATNGQELVEDRELSMTVEFECGELTFDFKRDSEVFFVAAIRGIVRLDASTTGEFVAEGPMFFTSDLAHHFKFHELIEVSSTTSPMRGFQLTANFYNSEFETFRKTSSRSFVMPPDENSQPFERVSQQAEQIKTPAR